MVKKKVVILGAGGHAHSVCDILLRDETVEVIGLLDNKVCEGFYGIPYLGTDDCLKKIYKAGTANYYFVAIGSNVIRKRLTEEAENIGLCPINAVSKEAVISPNASLGRGIAVMPGTIISAGVVIGNGAILNTNCSIDHDVEIGEFCHIAPGCTICGGVKIGNLTFLGAGSCVIDGITICGEVMVGAGGVVINDIMQPCTVVGVPAKKIIF